MQGALQAHLHERPVGVHSRRAEAGVVARAQRAAARSCYGLAAHWAVHVCIVVLIVVASAALNAAS